jgi:integrase
MIGTFSIVKQEVSMTQEKVSPLRERMMEDMRIRGMQETSQKAHIRALKDFTTFLGRSPDTAEPDDLRAYQLHMADTNGTPSTFNVRIVALRFFFSMTCDRDGMKKYMQFRTEPRKLPIVLSVEEVSALLVSAPGLGLKYRAALSIGYGGGLRASEVTHLKVRDIDSDRMLIHVERGKGGKDRDVMLSPSLLVLSDIASSAEPGVYISQTYGLDQKARNASHPAAQFCDTSVGGKHGCAGDPGPARAFQAEYDGAIHPCRDKDVGRYHQPV